MLKSTLPPVVQVGTNMSFDSCQDGKGTFLLMKLKQEFIEGRAYFELLTMVSMYPCILKMNIKGFNVFVLTLGWRLK